MAKRMIVMLAVTACIVAALGFVKFRQIQTAIAQGAAFQPPPEAVTTIVAQQEEWPATLSAIGTMAAVQGVTVSADLPGTVDRIAFDPGRSVREGEVLVVLDTRQERAQLAAVEAQRELARLNFDRMQGLLNERVISQRRVRPRDGRAADRRRRGSARSARRSSGRRSARRSPGILGIRQVNLGQYLAGGDPVVTLQSLNPIYVNFGVPQQAAGQVRVGRERAHHDRTTLAGVESTGRVTAIDSIVDEATRNIQVQATLANPDGTLRPGMFVQTEVVLGAGRSVVALPASAISYAPYGDSVFVVTDLKDRDGQAVPRRAPAVRQARAGARRSGRGRRPASKPGDEVVTSGVFKLRNGAAVQVNNKVQPAQQPGAEARGQLMKFTDLFVKRPVLAIVVNLVILIAGLQSIRALSVRQYPRSDIAVVRVTTVVRRRQRRPRARLHHDAARARHRQRRRHRLHGVVERAGAQHDHRAPEAQLRHQRRAHADPGEGRAGAQRPAARGRGADHRARDRRHAVRGDVPRLLVAPISIRTRSPTT